MLEQILKRCATVLARTMPADGNDVLRFATISTDVRIAFAPTTLSRAQVGASDDNRFVVCNEESKQ